MTLKSRLEVTQGHSKWCHSKAWVFYSHFIVTVAVPLAVCEISSVIEWRDLEPGLGSFQVIRNCTVRQIGYESY